MIKTEWDVTQCFMRPVSAILCIITILVWFYPLFINLLTRGRRQN